MDRRQFFKSLGVGLATITSMTQLEHVFAQTRIPNLVDQNYNKIEDSLERMLKDGTYPRYQDTDLVHVLITYHNDVTEYDIKVFKQVGGKVHGVSFNKILDGGLPPNKITEYTQIPNVGLIDPNYIVKAQPKK